MTSPHELSFDRRTYGIPIDDPSKTIAVDISKDHCSLHAHFDLHSNARLLWRKLLLGQPGAILAAINGDM